MNKTVFLSIIMLVSSYAVEAQIIQFTGGPIYHYFGFLDLSDRYKIQHNNFSVGATYSAIIDLEHGYIKPCIGLSLENMEYETEIMCDMPVIYNESIQYLLMNIPVKLYYAFRAPRKLNVLASVGYELCYTLKYRYETNRPHPAEKGLNSLSNNILFGVGLSYKFSEKISLQLEPYCRYRLNDFEASASLGLQLGFSYSLSSK